MHELPVTENILKIVQKHAEKNAVRRVISITLDVGAMSDLEDEWMQHYFDYLSRATVAEGATLIIHRVPIVLRCNNCTKTFEIEKDEIGRSTCPDCGAEGNFSLESGRQYYIREMQAE